MDAGTYGICERCGKPIPKARLKALPVRRAVRRLQERGAVASLSPDAGPTRPIPPAEPARPDPARPTPAPRSPGPPAAAGAGPGRRRRRARPATKVWAVSALADGPIHLLGSLRLALTHNTAGAFGLGGGLVPSWPWPRSAWWSTSSSPGAASVPPAVAVALGLVLGGAFGNLVDRLFRAPGSSGGRSSTSSTSVLAGVQRGRHGHHLSAA